MRCWTHFCRIDSIEPEQLRYDEIAAIVIYSSPETDNSLSYKNSKFSKKSRYSRIKRLDTWTLLNVLLSRARITHLRHKLACNTLKPFYHDGRWSFALLVADTHPTAERLLSLDQSCTKFLHCSHLDLLELLFETLLRCARCSKRGKNPRLWEMLKEPSVRLTERALVERAQFHQSRLYLANGQYHNLLERTCAADWVGGRAAYTSFPQKTRRRKVVDTVHVNGVSVRMTQLRITLTFGLVSSSPRTSGTATTVVSGMQVGKGLSSLSPEGPCCLIVFFF